VRQAEGLARPVRVKELTEQGVKGLTAYLTRVILEAWQQPRRSCSLEERCVVSCRLLKYQLCEPSLHVSISRPIIHAQKSRLLDGTICRGFDGEFMAFAFCKRLLHLVRAASLTEGPASPAKVHVPWHLTLNTDKTHTSNCKLQGRTRHLTAI
jgi:hypothetical protein